MSKLFDPDGVPVDYDLSVQSIGRSDDMPRYIALLFPGNRVFQFAGGPYRSKPRGWAGVKLAQEIRAECAVDLPVADFSVPDNPEQVEKALIAAIALANAGARVYAGCMGGIGRTGLFLALLTKVSERSTRRWWGWRSHTDPVKFVRQAYNAHACETDEQSNYVHDFYTGRVERIVKRM